MLRHVPIKRVSSPIERSILIGATGSIGITEAEQMEFFRSIDNPRFLQIRKHTGDAHVDDAYHLWTAEEATLDAFLTMDRRFWNVVDQKKKVINSSVLVVTPKDLCERLDLRPMDIEKMAAETNPFS